MNYFLHVLGCQMNHSDAERLASILERLGFKATKLESEANLIAVVACSVRQKAVDRIQGKVHNWQKTQTQRPPDNPLVTILTGCVLAADKQKLKPKFDLIIETSKLPSIATELKKLNFPLPKTPELTTTKWSVSQIDQADFLAQTPNYNSPFQAFVPIQTGCNNFCTFCAVPYTKGRETYRPHQQIINEITGLISKNYQEITLLGQNVNTYFDPTLSTESAPKQNQRNWQQLTDFPKLLQKIAQIPGKYWLKFLTSNPWDMSPETIKTIAQHPNICPYIHLPLQSGSDTILKKMNRHHTAQEYLDLVDLIKKTIPEVILTTDIIVGFPGETDQDFQATADIMKKVGYDMAYIAQYSQRPGTVASKVYPDLISNKIKKERWQHLNQILTTSSQQSKNKLVGKVITVLIDKKTKQGLQAKTRGQQTVLLQTGLDDDSLLGTFQACKIGKSDTFALHGELLLT